MFLSSDAFYSPLHYAGEGGKAECFNCLLQHGADLYAVNAKSEAPLDSAKRYGHPLLMTKAGTYTCLPFLYVYANCVCHLY